MQKSVHNIKKLLLLALSMSTEILTIEHYKHNCTINLPKNKTIVLVGGCFDILHFGHIQFLQKAKEAGDYLIVALEPDERITHYKKRISIHTQEERAYNLLALRSVDQVILLPILNGFEDYKQLVLDIKPHIIAVTIGDPHLLNKQKQAAVVNAECIAVTDRIDPFSSSMIFNMHQKNQ